MEQQAPEPFFAPIARSVWEQKYQLKRAGVAVDQTLDDTFWRVARAAAEAETGDEARSRWTREFHAVMARGEFLPGGRILAGAETGRNITLFNCFVLGEIEDDLGAIFEALKEAALTMQAGGGIGHDFSSLRPRGAALVRTGAEASGPVSFMDVWDSMSATIMSAGQRRGAMMATLRCDHPDIEEFIAAKATLGRLRHFNLSVLVTDAFMAAVKADTPWPLVFAGKTWKTLSARALWHQITQSNYAYAEPGVIFIDRINAANNLGYCERIHATNPCGEQPLPAYGACLLGSLNLARFVDQPFTAGAKLDTDRLRAAAAVAVRLLDDIIDISRFPLAAQQHEAKAKRRIGLGVTGLADALIMLGLRYGSPAAADAAASWMATIQNAAYRASALLAAEKGSFPLYDADAFLARPNVARLEIETQALLAKHGIRNGCLTSIAPTGTISLLAGNVSSGIEPVFDFKYQRRVLGNDGTSHQETVEDYAHARHRQMAFGTPAGPAWVTAADLTPHEHLAMQAALQPHVDSAISKTINCPVGIEPEAFEGLYQAAYDLGLKGCTLFRPNEVTGSVLSQLPAKPANNGPAALSPSMAVAAGSTADVDRTEAAKLEPRRSGSVVYMSEPLARDEVLAGRTTKLKWPGSENAYYVTINDIVRDGRRRPFEIFINTKDLTHFPWMVALTRMVSAVFRRGGDVSFVAEELESIFDPEGGRWMNGEYVPSVIAAIGAIVRTHLNDVANFNGEARLPSAPPRMAAAGGNAGTGLATVETGATVATEFGTFAGDRRALLDATPPQEPRPKFCPRCSSPRMRTEGNCLLCLACGHSSCG